MTPTNVSGISISQTLPLLSAETPNPSPQEKAGSLSAGVVLAKVSEPVPVDTVSIAQQTRQAIADAKNADVKKDEAKDDTKKDDAPSDNATAKVQFVYDLKGELITRYMDSTNRLIYQDPSELSLRQADTVSKANSSVDMKA